MPVNELISAEQLKFELEKEAAVQVIDDRQSDFPFGVIHLDSTQILCKIAISELEPKVDSLGQWYDDQRWRVIPLGKRATSDSRLTRKEKYPSFGWEGRFLRSLFLLGDFEFTSEFQGYFPEDWVFNDYPQWDDPRSKSIFDEVTFQVKNIVGPKSNILDMGCGVGKLGILLEKNYQCCGYFLDNNPKNIERAIQEYHNQRGTPCIGRFACTDSTKLRGAYGETQFDLITAIAFFEWELLTSGLNQQETLQAIFQQLKPGGYFISSGYMPLTITRKNLQEHGFVVERCSFPQNMFNLDLPKQFYMARKPY